MQRNATNIQQGQHSTWSGQVTMTTYLSSVVFDLVLFTRLVL